MRSPSLRVLALLCALCVLPGAAHAVDIDATALTSPTFRVGPDFVVPMNTSAVQSLSLAAGTHTFQDEANGIFSFDVDSGGLVSYAAALEPFLDGAGTTTLTVRGYDVAFDATALTSPTFRVVHVFPHSPTSTVQTATMLPAGFYGIDDATSNQIVFHVEMDGTFGLVAGTEDYLFGAGTSTLVIRGFDFTVDATALSSPSFRLLGISPIVTSTAVQSFTGIPGAYGFYESNSNNFAFSIDSDGGVEYPASHENFLDGAGSDALVVDGFTVGIEPCGLVPQASQYSISGHLLDNASTSVASQIVLIPGYYFLAAGDLLWFIVDGNGNLADLPATFLGVPVTGNGTNTLAIGSCATTGNVAGQVLAGCPTAGTPLLGVRVDAFEVGSGDLTGTAVTDAGGNYAMADLPSGDYTITVVTPLGYAAAVADVAATVGNDATEEVNFVLTCVAISSDPHSIGYWKHQVGVATGGPGHADVAATTLCSYLDLIEDHFNSNAINQVLVYQPAANATCADKLQVAKVLLNLHGATPMIQRAKQQLMALLLNVAAGAISQTAVISADGATVSQAITYCDQVIDSPTGDYEKAKTIADKINNGAMVPAGMIPLGTAQIAYRRGEEAASFHSLGSNRDGSREFRFANAVAGPVRLVIYDVTGRVVSTLVNATMAAGSHSVRWDGKSVSGARATRGVYFARFETARETAALKFVQVGAVR